MNCAEIDLALPDLLDGRKDALAEAHLASCAWCRARFRDLATTAAAVADLADLYRPPADADAALQRALYDRLRRRRAGVNPGWLAVTAVAGAALAVLWLRIAAPVPAAAPRVDAPAAGAPGPPARFEAAPAEAAPATASPRAEPVHARTQRRFREAVRAAQAAAPMEPVLDAYAEAPADAEEALALDDTLGGYFEAELRPRLLRGYLDRAASAVGDARWIEGCESARLAHRLDRTSDPAEVLLLRCEAEAERIATQANGLSDDSARRSMLRGALLVATPGSAAYRAIERALSPTAQPPPGPARP